MAADKVDPMLAISDVARMLKISERSVYRLVRSRKLPGFKPGGGAWRFRRADIDAWIDAQVQAGSRSRGRSEDDA